MDFKQYLKPFWEGDTIFGETILLVSDNGHTPDASLFFTPKKILSITSSDMTTEYIEGKDWELKNNKICKIPGSRIPSFADTDFVFQDNRPEESFPAKDGNRYVWYKPGGMLNEHQLLVTYTHNDVYSPDVGLYGGKRLLSTKQHLKTGSPFTICFYGDSITTGCDCSGNTKIPPFMPDWTKLITLALGQDNHCHIKYVNTAVGGKTSEWGVENAKKRLADYKPQLAVIAFGMNDGTEHISPEQFKKNISGIMETTLEKSKDCEFILVSPSLANPISRFDGLQREYFSVLKKCARESDSVIDITALHEEISKRKRFCDTTGNNINHPSDFLTRVYAQAILQAFK